MRTIRTVAVVGAMLALLTMHGRAEPGPIGQWLMDQPITLWDRGMDMAGAAAKAVARSVGESAGSAWPSGSANYSWNDNEITLLMTLHYFSGEVTHAHCNTLRLQFISHLVGYPMNNAGFETFALQTIDDWFSHRGYQLTGRDEKLAEKLSRIIFVAVQLVDDEMMGIRCRARIMELEARSKPLNFN